MASLNQCNFIGNCADAPEVRAFGDGGKIANIRVAVTEKYTDRSGQPKENTEWIPCVIGGKLADVAERFITKGMPIFITGKFHTRQWQDQQGNKHYASEITVVNFQLLSRQQNAPQAAPQYAAPTPPPAAPVPPAAPAPQPPITPNTPYPQPEKSDFPW